MRTAIALLLLAGGLAVAEELVAVDHVAVHDARAAAVHVTVGADPALAAGAVLVGAL